MFRSFFPEPRIFFSTAVIWLLVTTLAFFFFGTPIRSVIGIDRFVAPAVCAPVENPTDTTTPSSASSSETSSQASSAQASVPDAASSAQPTAPTTQANCAPDTTFLNADRIWLYEYVLLIAVVFCAFWYFYKRNEWYWWSVVGSAVILLFLYFQVQIDAWVNDWQGDFFNLLQQALSQPRSVPGEVLYGKAFLLLAVIMPNILVQVIFLFYNSHYVFRWRKAMTSYYMVNWPAIRTTEGAAQRVQEDTMRFASIVEDLGTSFFSSLITLVVFLPILWNLSHHITELPIFGTIPGSLVWVALVTAAIGTALLGLIGFRLPGLNFENQKVEAAYRKELVYGEDDPLRADPPNARQLFANVQKNYFRMYFHYTYFNLFRYFYLNLVGYVPLFSMLPSIIAGTLTLGIYQQIQNAFGQVAASFQFFARAWSTIVELMSITQRLRRFESFIPKEQEAIKEDLGPATI